MATLLAFAANLNSFGMPIIGIGMLLASKLSTTNKTTAEGFFIAALTLVTLVTLRTVSTNDPAWLTHTLTLAAMIIGAVWLPAMCEPHDQDQ